MDVYAVTLGFDYEGEALESVWASVDEATKRMGELVTGKYGDSVLVYRCPVGGAAPVELASARVRR